MMKTKLYFATSAVIRKALLLLSFVVLCLTTFAGDIDKAYKALNSGDYANAYKFLKEVLSDEPQNVAGNFGLARYYFFKDNQAYSLDSANTYIKLAAAKIPLNQEDKENKKFNALGVRDYTIQALEHNINFEAYQVAEKQNSLESYQHFVDFYKDPALLEQAVNFRNQKAYMRAMSLRNPDAIAEFVQKYPNAAEVQEAKERYEKLLYDQITGDGTYQSFKKYMDSVPKGKYFAEAKSIYEDKLLSSYHYKHTLEGYLEFESKYREHPAFNAIQDSIYAMTVSHGWIDEFKKFVRTYKTNRNVKDAWSQLYTLSTAEGTPESFQKFQADFPDFPDKELLAKDLGLSYKMLKPFQRDNKWGYGIQPAPDSIAIVFPFEYEEAYDFQNGLAVVRLKPCNERCNYFYIDKNNQRVFNRDFNYASDFNNGVAIVGIGDCESSDCKYGLIDKRGEFILPAEFEELNDPTDGLYLAAKDSKYGFVNSKGEAVVSFKYTDALPFAQGLAAVAIDGNWFFVDVTGAQKFINRFMDCSSFSDSLCAVTQDKESWGYIDMTGNFVIQPSFESAEDFVGGFAIVSKKEKDPKNKSLTISQRYKIDKSGKILEKLTAPKEPSSKSKKKGRR